MWIKYEAQGLSQKLFKLLIVKYLFLYSFHICLVNTSLYQATPPSPIPTSFYQKHWNLFLFCFAFHSWWDSMERSVCESGQCKFARNSHKCISNIGCSKGKRKNEKVSPQGVITWSPKAWENRGGDNQRQLIARELLPVHSSLTLC